MWNKKKQKSGASVYYEEERVPQHSACGTAGVPVAHPLLGIYKKKQTNSGIPLMICVSIISL